MENGLGNGVDGSDDRAELKSPKSLDAKEVLKGGCVTSATWTSKTSTLADVARIGSGMRREPGGCGSRRRYPEVVAYLAGQVVRDLCVAWNRRGLPTWTLVDAVFRALAPKHNVVGFQVF